MKKRVICFALFLLLLGLSGCCMKHEWAAATCTVPETCGVCGEMQGEALGHEWTEANYHQASCCSVCGEKNGEPLVPEFVEHGLEVIEVDIGGEMWRADPADYVTGCAKDYSKLTVGKLEMMINRVDSISFGEGADCSGDEFAELMGVEPQEDYILISTVANITFSDENANSYGISAGKCVEDYYTIRAHDDSTVFMEETASPGDGLEYTVASYVVNVNGEEMPAYRFVESSWSPWTNNEVTYFNTTYYYIPDGYDGTVDGLYCNQVKEWPEGAYIYDLADENAHFYRIIT